MTVQKKRRKKQLSTNAFDPAFEERFLAPIAKRMAGKSLDESPGSELNNLIGRIVEMALKEEMNEHLGYLPNERQSSQDNPRDDSVNARNGYSAKTLKTSQGDVDIKIPRDRHADFEPHIVPKHQSMSKEVEARIISMYTLGLTTRDIVRHVEEIYGISGSSMLVSRLSKKLDDELTLWRDRPLEALYPILFVDAMYMPIRHDNGVSSTAVYNVSVYNENGRLEVIGLYISKAEMGRKESSTFWHQIFIKLQKRGLKDVLILCADGLAGLEDAARTVFPEMRFQPCVVHLIRASTRLISHKDRSGVCKSLKEIYAAPSYEVAEIKLEQLKQQWNDKYPGIIKQWQSNLPRLADLWTYGEFLRKAVYTTNAIENVHRQVRKVTKNRGSLPSVDSALRLFSLVLRDINKKEANKARPRNDWRAIINELHIHFEERLPKEWGHRMQVWR